MLGFIMLRTLSKAFNSISYSNVAMESAKKSADCSTWAEEEDAVEVSILGIKPTSSHVLSQVFSGATA